MNEIWKAVRGYEGIYEVSDQGYVRSLPREVGARNNKKRWVKGKMMTGSDNGNGYKSVMLTIDGHGKRHYIHRLVAEAFIPNPNDFSEINHKNEDKGDNRAVNLEWITHKDNINYGSCIEKIAAPQSFEVKQFDYDGNYIATYRSIVDASRKTGINYSDIRKCINGKTVTAGGYIWISPKKPSVKFPSKEEIIKARHAKSVDQYDIDGHFIKTYMLMKDAAEDNNINSSAICGCCRMNLSTAGGYVWRYHGDSFGTIKKVGKPVVQIDVNTNVILNTFKTIIEAAEYINGDPSAITKCCKHKQKTYKNYKWEYVSNVT